MLYPAELRGDMKYLTIKVYHDWKKHSMCERIDKLFKEAIMKEKYKGIICIVIAAFFFALMSLFVKLSGDLPVFQKSFFRNIVAVFFALIVLIKNKPEIKINKGDFVGLVLRSTFGTIGVLCNFYAVDHLLLADATILNKLSPFFAVLMSALILKEKIKPFQIVTISCALCGALFVIKPGSGIIATPALIGLLGGMGAAAAYTMVRWLGKRGVSGPFVVFFFSAFSCIVLAPFTFMNFTPMSAQQLFYLVMAGTSAAIAQFAITNAYFYAPAREISVFDYTQIIFSALLGFFIFQQIPDTFSWIGYAIIMSSAIANFMFNKRVTNS